MMSKYLSHKLRTVSFLLSILVVFCHAQNLIFNFGSETKSATRGFNWIIQEMISQGISKIASPFFFIIAGYTFFLNIEQPHISNFYSKFKRRYKTLILPYLIWSTIGVLLFFTLQSIPFSEKFFTKEIIADLSFPQLLSKIFINPIPYQLWFIRDLTILFVLSPIIFRLVRYFNIYAVLIFFILWISDFSYVIFDNRSILFFSFGGLFSIKNINPQKLKLHRFYLIFLTIWMLFIILKTYLNYIDSENELLINSLHKFSILIGVTSIWYSYDYFFEKIDISKTKIFNIFKYGFFIYVSHEPLLTIFKKGMYYILGFSQLNSFLIYITAPTISIFLSITTAYYMKKFIPNLYKLLSGGR